MKHHFPKRQAECKQMLARRKEEVGIIPKPTTEKDNFKENFDKMIDTLSNIESSIDGGLNDNGGKLFEIVKNEDDHRYTSSSFLKKFDAKDK